MSQIQMLEGLFGNTISPVAGGSRVVQDDSAKIVSGYLGFGEDETVPGTEKVWPKVMAPTNSRASRFQQNLKKDVVSNSRHMPQAIKNRRMKLKANAKQHASMASKHAVAAKKAKSRIDMLKSEIKKTPAISSASVAKRADLTKKILDNEVVGRAHAALFAQHTAAAQKAVISESILAQAQNEPSSMVRAEVVAAAETVEKVPERGEVEKVAMEQVDSKVNTPNGVPTVKSLVRNSRFARQIVSRGGIPGLYDYVREHNEMQTVGTFIHGLGQNDIYSRQLDRWGRPLPGASPRDAAMVNWIVTSAPLGGFTGGFGGFDGWWTSYKKRAKKRWRERLDRLKKRTKKSVSSAASKATSAAVEKAGDLVTKGLNAGINKIGNDPVSVSQTPVMDMTVPEGRSSVLGDMVGVSLPGWVDYVGAAVGIAGGAMIIRKVSRRRRAGF